MGKRLRPYRRNTALSLCLAVITVALSTAVPLLLQRVIDEALPRRDTTLLTTLCGLMLLMGLAASLLAIAQTALTNWIAQRVSSRLRVDVYDRAHAQPLRFYSEKGPTQVQSRLVSDIDGIERLLTGTLQQALGSVVTLITACVAMVVLSWPLAVLSVTLAALLSVFNTHFARRRRDLARRRQGLLTTVLRYVAEDLSLSGVLLGRTLRRTDAQRRRFVAVSDEIQEVTFRQRMVGMSAITIIGASFACIPPLIYWIYGTFLPGVSIGTVVVLVMLQARLASPMQSLLRLSGTLQTSVAMFERVLEYLDMTPADVPPAPEATPVAAGPAELRLRGVSYHYPGAPAPAIAGLDLDLPPGSVTVVTGRTGSGKSTLGLILAGLLPPDSGSVRLDSKEGTGRLRSAVTLLPQHIALLHGTVRDNLLFARDDATPTELDRALEAVGLDTVVAALGQGIDTPVGENGLHLSGGERQRLGIARALLADCRTLVVDEATSALDHHTADLVNRALRTHCRDKTLVLITHRLPDLEPDDRVVVLDRGRVAEFGTHAGLSATGGEYAALLAAQRGGTVPTLPSKTLSPVAAPPP
ncbi:MULTISPECIES: ABC transporter ATP-binding protein [unclassified Streptomyces]|uniref:ABC transporter ATP-binding protein n=1 Tax=unclassified Streptomyces TaxID=2593676 RepID=UPI0033B9CD4A